MEYPQLVEQIHTQAGQEALYNVVLQVARHRVWQQIGWQDSEDALHDIYLGTFYALQQGMRNPWGLKSLIGCIADRTVVKYIRCRQYLRRHEVGGEAVEIHPIDPLPGPDRMIEEQEYQKAFRHVVRHLPNPIYQEIATRLYLHQEKQSSVAGRFGGMQAKQWHNFQHRTKRALVSCIRCHLNIEKQQCRKCLAS